jgi:hypothetical protein
MNPVTETLKQVLCSALDGVEFFDYSVARDFERLWKCEGLPDRIVIIWGRTASDGTLWPIDASACLSPLDWAAAYARHLFPEQAKQEQAQPPEQSVPMRHWPQIMILDADPAAHTSVPTLAHFHTLREDQFPWLTVPKEPTLADVCQWLHSPATDVNQNTQAALDRFLREIRLNLTEVRSTGDFDRHSISNIVVPVVLLGDTVTGSRHSNALLQVIKACGLLPVIQKFGKIEQVAAPQALLVDDQADHGWSKYLQAVLGKTEVLTAPILLVQRLREQLDDEQAKDPEAKDLRFKLKLPELEDAKHPVLFLDLRLFSGRPEAECRFYAEMLLPLMGRFTDREDLAWPSFSSRDINDARNEIESGMKILDLPDSDPTKKERFAAWQKRFLESPAHHQALTWLPRLLALVDMSLPIILFSSTGRRQLIEPFKAYGNIITSVEKPYLSDLAQQTPDAIRYNLKSALETCRKITNARRKVRFVSNLQKASLPKLPPDGIPHIELHIDEKFDAAWNGVGGVYSIFKSEEAARAFDDVLVKGGLNYFDRNGLDPTPNVAVHSKNTDALPILETAIEKWRDSDQFIWMGIACLEDSYRQKIIASDVTDPKVADNRYRILLRALIEHFLAECVPLILGDRQGTLSIYCGTRLLYINDARKRVECIGRFGLNQTQFDQRLLYSFGDDDLLPVATEAIDHHPEAAWESIAINRCRAFSIPYYKAGRNTAPVPLIAPDRPSPSQRFLQAFPNAQTALRAAEHAWQNDFAVSYLTNRGTVCWYPKRDSIEDASGLGPGEVVAKDATNTLVVVPRTDWEHTDITAWRPDVPLLLYVADCILRPGGMGRCPSVSKDASAGIIGDVLDITFMHTQDAGRALDRGDIGEALRRLPDGSGTKGNVRHCVANVGLRMGQMLNILTGHEFIASAMDAHRGTYRAVFPRWPQDIPQPADSARPSTDESSARQAPASVPATREPATAGTRLHIMALGVRDNLKDSISSLILNKLKNEACPAVWHSSSRVNIDRYNPGKHVVSFNAAFSAQDAEQILANYGKDGGRKRLYVKQAMVLISREN